MGAAAMAMLTSAAEAHGMTLGRLRAGGRLTGRFAAARDEAIWVVLQTVPEVPLAELARYFGRDHSTIISGQRVFEARMERDDVLRARMARIVGGRTAVAA